MAIDEAELPSTGGMSGGSGGGMNVGVSSSSMNASAPMGAYGGQNKSMGSMR